MEAPMKAVAIKCHASSPVLSLPPAAQHYLPNQTTRFCHRGSLSDVLSLKCGASTPCYCSASTSASVTDQRLDFILAAGSVVIPHPAKVEKGGEDAHFVSNYYGGCLGVADGVSGWAEENVDPALFSRELMEHAVTALDSELVGTCPRQLLAKAYEATSAIGAATVIVAILEREAGLLHVANLGDCGLRVVREGKIVFATSTQEHYFDCPYQLSSEAGAQTSKDARVYKVEMCPGDIIVMGSDGLFDNVFDKDIESTVNLFGGSDVDVPHRIASALASLACKHSRDVKYESPYSREAILQGYDLPVWKKLLGQKLTGGKLDDITVVIAHVVLSLVFPKNPPFETVQQVKSCTTEGQPEPEAELSQNPPLIDSILQKESCVSAVHDKIKTEELLVPGEQNETKSDFSPKTPPIETAQQEESLVPVEQTETEAEFSPKSPLVPSEQSDTAVDSPDPLLSPVV